MRRLLTAALVGVALVGAGVTALPPPARAHSPLLSSSPGPGDRVAPGAAIVALTFTALRAGAPLTVTVVGPGEAPILAGPAVLVGIATVCATVRPLQPGIHAITYSATSDDGDPVEGKYFFEVTAAGPPVVTPDSCLRAALPSPGATLPPAARTTPARDGGSAVLPVIGVAVVAAGAGGWWLTGWLRRRRRATGRAGQ